MYRKNEKRVHSEPEFIASNIPGGLICQIRSKVGALFERGLFEGEILIKGLWKTNPVFSFSVFNVLFSIIL